MATGGYEYNHEVSRATYRRRTPVKEEIERYALNGIKVDVCHIIAEDNGGADDDRNYILCPRGFNRSIGARWDPLMFAVAYEREPTEAKGKKKVEDAIRASQPTGCPYKIKDAQKLVDEGIALFPFYYQYQKRGGLKWEDVDIEDPADHRMVCEVWEKGLQRTVPIVPIKCGGANHGKNLLEVHEEFHNIDESEDLVFALAGAVKLKRAIRFSPGCDDYKENDAASHVERGKRRFKSAHKQCHPQYYDAEGRVVGGGNCIGHIPDPGQLRDREYCQELAHVWNTAQQDDSESESD